MRPAQQTSMGGAGVASAAVSDPQAAPGLALARTRAAIIACDLCPRLRSYCQDVARVKKAAHRADTYWGRPVPGFGDARARLLIVGLAPAAHGANRTGRVFTGDGSGDFLMRALHQNGFASLPTARDPGDGLTLSDAYILSVVRCAPPDNRPLPEEVARCQVHLKAELLALPRVRVVVALGKIGWDGFLAHMSQDRRWSPVTGDQAAPDHGSAEAATRRARPAFGHGAAVSLGAGLPILLGSYHPSRQNTNTGRLTAPMLHGVFARARRLIETGPFTTPDADQLR